MKPSAHAWFERKRLKAQLRYWRSLCIILFVGGLMLAAWLYSDPVMRVGGRPFIARITIEGIIVDDAKRNDLLKNIAENDQIKAVLVQLDTPGGTTLGGEELYNHLRKISEKKPVVALMRTLCASAGYMAALGTNQIFAHETTLTGSIGVILQAVEISGLAEKIGINPITIKAGKFKDTPSMFHKPSQAELNAIQPVVDDTYDYFVNLVKINRKLSGQALEQVTNGRVFTGRQAKAVSLIDAIGGEEEALKWLKTAHNIETEHLRVRDLKPKDELEGILKWLDNTAIARLLIKLPRPLDGMVSIWHPSL
jgi:protease-4